MKKCPRCGHELKDDENFCSHCGLDLRNHYHRKPNNKAMTYLLYVIIFFSFITIPVLYSRILSGMTGYETIQQNEKVALPAIEGEATALIASYDTLADFQNQFSNVDSIVENIQQYEPNANNHINENSEITYPESGLPPIPEGAYNDADYIMPTEEDMGYMLDGLEEHEPQNIIGKIAFQKAYVITIFTERSRFDIIPYAT